MRIGSSAESGHANHRSNHPARRHAGRGRISVLVSRHGRVVRAHRLLAAKASWQFAMGTRFRVRVSHKSGTAARRCGIHLPRRDVAGGADANLAHGRCSHVASVIALECSPMPPTYATASRETRRLGLRLRSRLSGEVIAAGLSRRLRKRKFPQVLTRRLKEDLRRETYRTAVGGDRVADRPAARRGGG
jgi:hypothetical protein